MAPPNPVTRLAIVKVLHTLIWAFFVVCILALPIAGGTGRWDLFFVLNALIGGEVLVLALNRGRCPLTDLAERFTEDRKENFDIYLPRWLAANNKRIFGTLWVLGEFPGLARWVGWA